MTRSELYLTLSEALAAAKPRTPPEAAFGPDPKQLEQWEADVGHIATALSAHHKGFDRERFRAACGGAVTPRVPPEEASADACLVMDHARTCGRKFTVARLDAFNVRNLAELHKIGGAALIECRKLLRDDILKEMHDRQKVQYR
jgi:hypothetical protein